MVKPSSPRNEDLTLAGFVHDLNNIFQNLVEVADVLSQDPQNEYLAAALLRSVERGRDITLAITAAQEDPAPLMTVVNRAQGWVEDALISRRSTAIRFLCDLEAGLEVQRSRSFERVLINLFSNSVRAMPSGGTIAITAHRQSGRLCICIADDGPGIPPKLLPDIFRPDVSTRTGSGLGLHIVETLVREAQGEIRAANRSQGGAEFTILLPGHPALLRRATA